MPITAQFKSKKWFNQYKNGVNVNQNLTDFTPNLRGVPLEKVKFVGEVIIYQVVPITGFFISLFNGSDVTNGFSIKTNGDSLLEISVGDEFDIVYDTGHVASGIASSVSENLLFSDVGSGSILQDNDGNFNGNNQTGTVWIVIKNQIDYLKYKWGFSDQSGEKNTQSRLDGRTNSFEISGITAAAQSANKSLLNANDDDLKVTRLPNFIIPENKFLVNRALAQRFLVEHTFIVDDYSEQDIQNLENGSFPDRYLGELTENYFSVLEFRNIESAPETAKILEYQDDSDIGWYREKFNEGVNDFSISNVEITRLSNGELMPDISSQEPSKIKFTVSSNVNVFGGGLNYHGVHKTLLTGQEYEFADVQDSSNTYVSLFDFENLPNENTNTANGSIIRNLVASNITDFSADIEFEVHVGKTYEETKYVTGIIIGDIRNDNLSRKTVTLPVKIGTYFNEFDIEGLLDNMKIELFQRNCDPYTLQGYSSMRLIQGDFIYTKFSFEVLDGLIDSIDLVTVNGNGEEIDSVEIDTSSFILINGEQEINEVLPTPYSHGLDGIIRKTGSKTYEVIFPYRMPFEKLIAVSGLGEEFFNQSEPNKGFNESAFYQQSLGSDIKIAYKVGMFAENRVTYYRKKTPVILIRDFETPY